MEDESNDSPGNVVDGAEKHQMAVQDKGNGDIRSGRDETSSGENDGEVDIADEAVRPLERDEVCEDRADGADEEEERQSCRRRRGRREAVSVRQTWRVVVVQKKC